MKALLAGLALMMAASTAMAQFKDSGWYIGAGTGPTSMQNVCDTFLNAGGYESCDDNSVGWKVLLGKQVYKYTYLELQYLDAGESKVVAPGSTGEFDVHPRMVSMFLKFQVPVAIEGRLGVFFKFGGNYFDTTYDTSGSYAGGQDGDDGIEPAIGAGVSWRGWDKFSLQLEWENFNDATTINAGDINMGSVSLLYHF